MDRWLLYAGCVLLSGCVLGRGDRSVAPIPTRAVEGPLTIQADFPIGERPPILTELTQLRARVSSALALPVTNQPVEIYLFASAEKYHATLAERFPGFPVRRAFFVKHGGRFEVYSHWSERAGEDLRHETTHAYLHASIPDLPLWLDEGLAEYFETSPAVDGWNAPHVELLLRELHAGRWRPNLPRMEAIASSAEMTQLDYAEAWSWTWLLLRSQPQRRELLIQWLRAGAAGQARAPLAEVVARNELAAPDALIVALENPQRQRLASGAP
jgi:hypothetical protein